MEGRISRLTLNCMMVLGSATMSVLASMPVHAAEMDASKCPVATEWQNAFNRNDPTAVVALYTSDATEVSPGGIITGPQEIKKRIENGIKEDAGTAVITTSKCDVESSYRWSSGQWKTKPSGGPASGFWTAIEVKDGSAWKIQNLTYSLTPPPPAK